MIQCARKLHEGMYTTAESENTEQQKTCPARNDGIIVRRRSDGKTRWLVCLSGKMEVM
uniref:Uncharacterized protein n=1 Tax=Arundo donax TaxID=35708 RepID=A0A0A9CH77_ARUDO